MGENFYPSPETLRTSYMGYLEDIRRSKNQQWQVANYSLLIQAAIFAGVRYVNETLLIKLSPSLGWLFMVASGLIFLFSLIMIWIYQCDIEDYRYEKTKYENKLNIEPPKEPLFRKWALKWVFHVIRQWLSKWGFFVIFSTVMLAAAIFNIWHTYYLTFQLLSYCGICLV